MAGQKKKSNQSELWAGRIARASDLILSSKMVAIDPSVASTSSKPGYALFQAGVFIEQGIFDISPKPLLSVRLRHIKCMIREYFLDVDVAIIEQVPVKPIRTKKQAQETGKTWMNHQAHNSLMQAIGATKASFELETELFDMPAPLWQKIARNNGWIIDKADDSDARLIGEATLHIARGSKK